MSREVARRLLAVEAAPAAPDAHTHARTQTPEKPPFHALYCTDGLEPKASTHNRFKQQSAEPQEIRSPDATPNAPRAFGSVCISARCWDRWSQGLMSNRANVKLNRVLTGAMWPDLGGGGTGLTSSLTPFSCFFLLFYCVGVSRRL